MNNKERQAEYITALLEFVKRAAEKGATAEEVNALPAVAEVLRCIWFSY